jgi:hypothetical protein
MSKPNIKINDKFHVDKIDNILKLVGKDNSDWQLYI